MAAPIGGIKGLNYIPKTNTHNYPYKITGKAIKEAREASGMSQFEACYWMGTCVNNLAGAERGYRWTSQKVYKQICEYLKLDYRSLMIKDQEKILEEEDGQDS